MRLGALLDGLGAVTVDGDDIDVRGVCADSRRVRRGDAFFALAGRATDGRRHVAEALARGAAVVVADGALEAPGVVRVRCPEPRRLLGHVAARLAGDPSAALTLVGVTGTNGKTTTTYLLEGIWHAAGGRPGVIGTIAYRFAGENRPAPFTTPEAPELQAMLAEMRGAGVTHVAIEVSSHALAQHRADGLRFDAAAFSNLTRDHLDFHGDVEAYYAAKARLLLELLPASGKRAAAAVVNVDDAAGARLAREVSGRCVRVGRGPDADVHLGEVRSTLDGTRGTIMLDGRPMPFTSPLRKGGGLVDAPGEWLVGRTRNTRIVRSICPPSLEGVPRGAPQSLQPNDGWPSKSARCRWPWWPAIDTQSVVPLRWHRPRRPTEWLDPGLAVDLWQGAIGFTVYARRPE
jgi:UDP-N-acetylmuramoyl-L-alanyl-D-glutamate--2,6-diaminopimelate ligase